MESHSEMKWCCVSSLTKIVTFFAVPFWSIQTPSAPANPGQHGPSMTATYPQHSSRHDAEHIGRPIPNRRQDGILMPHTFPF